MLFYPDTSERKYVKTNKASTVYAAMREHEETGRAVIVKTRCLWKTVAEFPAGISKALKRKEQIDDKQLLILQRDRDRTYRREMVANPYKRFYGLTSRPLDQSPMRHLVSGREKRKARIMPTKAEHKCLMMISEIKEMLGTLRKQTLGTRIAKDIVPYCRECAECLNAAERYAIETMKVEKRNI